MSSVNFSMFKAFRQDAQGKCLDLCGGLLKGRAIGHRTGNLDDFGNPPPIVFAFGFYAKINLLDGNYIVV